MRTSDQASYIHSILYNKRVAVIGGYSKHPPVDLSQFDFVMWCNDHYVEGEPCHAVFTVSCIPPRKRYPRLQLLFVQHPGRWLVQWHSAVEAELGFTYCPFDHTGVVCERGPEQMIFQRLHAELHTRPFTGINAVNWLLHQPIRSLYVTGMSFYMREEDKKVPWKVGPHEINPQREWLWKQSQIDPRVTLDPLLQELCYMPPRPRRLIHNLYSQGNIKWDVRVEELSCD